jgi:hypothetical protein
VAAEQASAKFHSDVDRMNNKITQNNLRITNLLKQTTGMELENNPMKWWKWWWQEYNETYTITSVNDGSSSDSPESPKTVIPYESFETYIGAMPNYTPFNAYPVSFQSTSPLPSPSSCFAPGTIVWTQLGRRPIEKIKIGDRVLSQNAETGEMAYQTVLGTTVRRPGPRIKVGLGSDSITATPGHPFWVNGKNWQLAKLLEAGQNLHTLSGAATIECIEKVEPDPTSIGYSYNLIVADYNTYFVGERGILVHDNTPRRPTSMLIPGLPADTVASEEHPP